MKTICRYLLLLPLLQLAPAAENQSASEPSSFKIGNHYAVYDSKDILQPWTSWTDALRREVNWYLKCPVENDYPRFVYMTFMDGNYQPIDKRPSFIPATQDGMGIISKPEIRNQNPNRWK